MYRPFGHLHVFPVGCAFPWMIQTVGFGKDRSANQIRKECEQMNRLSFSELGLSSDVLKAVEDLGYEEATPIQTATIPLLMAGRDVLGQSQTGTGKTAAFGIPAVEKVDPHQRHLQVLILCPTRELAVQAAEEMKKFAKHKRGIRILPIYGGQSIDRQILALRQGVHIVIGTPGRVMDHMRRGTLQVNEVTTLILDEADEMLNMGFREDIETICKDVPEARQTVLFSATMSPEIQAITKRFQRDPETVKASHQQLTVPSIEQVYFEVPGARKADALSRLIDLYDPKLALIFCNTKKRVDDLVSTLQLRGYQADGLHGDLKQSARDRVMDKFRTGRIQLLVATDVAARGIDVDDIEMVFNFDIPQDEEYYVHRIGRTGRAGASGTAISFVNRNDVQALQKIERFIGHKVTVSAVTGMEARFKPGLGSSRPVGKPGGKPAGKFAGKPGSKPAFGKSAGAGRAGASQKQPWQDRKPAHATPRHADRGSSRGGRSGYAD